MSTGTAKASERRAQPPSADSRYAASRDARPHLAPGRRACRDCVLGWARHDRGRGLDPREGRGAVRPDGRPRPVRRDRRGRRPRTREGGRRRGGDPRRLPPAPRPRGARRAPLRGLPRLVRREDVLQHDPARARGDGDDARARDARARGRRLGRRLHVQGQRHRALLSLRPARRTRRCGSTSPGSTRSSSRSWAAGRR